MKRWIASFAASKGNPGRLLQRSFYLSLFVAVSIAVSVSSTQAAIKIKPPTNHVPRVVGHGCTLPGCPDVIVKLNPDPVTYLAPPAAGSDFMNTFIADVAQYAGWTATTASALNGDLNIKDYKAVYHGGCRGGARMDATYNPPTTAPADPSPLTFVQMWYDNYSGAKYGDIARHIDPFPNEPGDTEPFYYTATERATHKLNFIDNPANNCLACGKLTWNRFDTYLCSWDAAKKEVYVHDGWTWGYDLNCVPEPSSQLIWLMGLGVVVVRLVGRNRLAARRR